MSTQNKQEKFHAWLHALNSTLFCVSQLKNKIFYKYTKSVCWQLFYALNRVWVEMASCPIIIPFSALSPCWHSLHSVLVCRCFFLEGRNGTVGVTSDWAVVWTNCSKSLEQGTCSTSHFLCSCCISFIELSTPLVWRRKVWKIRGREKDSNVPVWITVWNAGFFYWQFKHFK